MQDRALEKFQQAEALYMATNKPQEAAKLFKELLEVNYLPALLHLDRLYSGPLKNKAESNRYLKEVNENRAWFEEQASQGTPEAQYNLGLLCARNKEFDTAFKYYESAAAQNHLFAKFRLGVLYADGLGVEKNITKAEELFKPTADLGYFCTRKELSYLYWFQKKYPEAIHYARLNLKEDCDKAQFMLGEAYHFGLGVEKNDTTALEFFHMAALQNLPAGIFWVGQCYYFGIGVTQDVSEGVTWLKKAASFGLARAQLLLGSYYNNKYFSKRDLGDFLVAEFYMNQAAVQGNLQAQNSLHTMQVSLLSSFNDNLELFRFFQMLYVAVDDNNAESQYILGACLIDCFNTFGLKIGSVEEGVKLIKESASQKYCAALMWLANAHFEGECIPKNHFQALEYYSQVDLSLRSGDWWHGVANIFSQLDLSDFAKIPDNLQFIMKNCTGKETGRIQLEMRVFCLSQALETKELPKEKLNAMKCLLQISQNKLHHFGKEKIKFVRRTKIGNHPQAIFAANTLGEGEVNPNSFVNRA